MTDIAIVDYGMGNLRAVHKALEHVAPTVSTAVTSDPDVVRKAKRVVVPGQGAMRNCMHELEARGLRQAVMEAAADKPFLGICLGLQMLFEESEEGNVKGLNILPGKVVHFPATAMKTADGHKLKVPHMGWNQVYQTMQSDTPEKIRLQKELRGLITAGKINVNIMTKLDKTNYDNEGNELPAQFSDALSALRGYADSKIKSSIVFSAGLNPRLFSYCETFEDFYPDLKGAINKKIILKVSDYRSALIQGKYLATKGLWISEFRIESGINCGGHAFISNGILLGPILEDFKNKRNDLYNELFIECENALKLSGSNAFTNKPELKITAQGSKPL